MYSQDMLLNYKLLFNLCYRFSLVGLAPPTGYSLVVSGTGSCFPETSHRTSGYRKFTDKCIFSCIHFKEF